MSITETENILKHELKNKSDYEKIQNTIKSNELATKKVLHQQKFEKLNIL